MKAALLVFLLSSMLGVGLSLTPQQIFAPLRKARLVSAALFANFVVVPVVAAGVARLFGLDEPFAIGLLLLGLAPGAPFLPKLVELAKGDLAFSVGLMALLMAGSVVLLPLVLPVLLPGVQIGVWPVARPLLLWMALPLIAGIVFRGLFGEAAARIRMGLNWVSSVSLLIVMVLVVALNLPSVLRVLGSGAIAAGILFTALAGLAGHALGGADLSARKVVMLGTGFRNIAAALVVEEEDFRDPEVMVMLVIAVLAGMLLLVPIALAWGRHSLQPAPIPAPNREFTLSSHDPP